MSAVRKCFPSAFSSKVCSASDQLHEKMEARKVSWGTFRSNLYFGLRTNAPQSLLIGLMWYDLTVEEGWKEMRHHCQNEDGLEHWGWVEHDGRNYGKEMLADPALNLQLVIWFIRRDEFWDAFIEATPLDASKPFNVGIIVYGLHEGEPEEFTGALNEDTFFMYGKRSLTGNFRVNVTHTHHGPSGTIYVHQRSQMSSFKIPSELFWRFKGKSVIWVMNRHLPGFCLCRFQRKSYSRLSF